MLGLARRTPCGHHARGEPGYGERRSEMRAVRRTKVLLLGLGATMLLATPGEAAAYTPIGNSSCRLAPTSGPGLSSVRLRSLPPLGTRHRVGVTLSGVQGRGGLVVVFCRRLPTGYPAWVPRCCWGSSGTPRHIASAGICCSRRRFGRAPTRCCPGWFEPTDRRPPGVSPTARSGKRPPSRSGRRRLDGWRGAHRLVRYDGGWCRPAPA